MYKLKIEVSANERDEIVTGIKSLTKLAEKQLVEAGRYSTCADIIAQQAKLVRQATKLRYYFGYSHEYKNTES